MADQKPRRFTFDPEKEGGKVPTLTELLYSKNVVKSRGSADQGRHSPGGQPGEQDHSRIMTLDPTVTMERPMPEEIQVADPYVRSDIGSNPVQPASMGSANTLAGLRRVMAAAIPFSMRSVSHPIPHSRACGTVTAIAGIQFIAEKTKLQASLVFEAEGDSYQLRTILAEDAQRGILWHGMEILKSDFTDLLGRLQKFGFAEFSTLGVAGQGNFDRTAFRTAFQTNGSEWTTLVPIVTSQGKEALIVFFTEGSIQALLPSFHAANTPVRLAA